MTVPKFATLEHALVLAGRVGATWPKTILNRLLSYHPFIANGGRNSHVLQEQKGLNFIIR